MTVLQLVLKGNGTSQHIEPQPNPEGKDPEELQKEGIQTVDVGSDLLIKFASSLSHAGFRVLGISLVDRYFAEVDDEFSKQIVPLFSKLLSSDLDAAQKFKNDYLSDLFVNDIRLLNRQTGNVVTLGQEGVVHANTEEIEYLSTALNKAL